MYADPDPQHWLLAVDFLSVQASVWTLEDMEDDTVELIDEASLVEEADLAKPDPASLRVCGTTGQYKTLRQCCRAVPHHWLDANPHLYPDFHFKN